MFNFIKKCFKYFAISSYLLIFTTVAITMLAGGGFVFGGIMALCAFGFGCYLVKEIYKDSRKKSDYISNSSDSEAKDKSLSNMSPELTKEKSQFTVKENIDMTKYQIIPKSDKEIQKFATCFEKFKFNENPQFFQNKEEKGKIVVKIGNEPKDLVQIVLALKENGIEVQLSDKQKERYNNFISKNPNIEKEIKDVLKKSSKER